MTAVVDICNLALSHLGDRATLSSIDPPEGSPQADHCATFWPIARDEALTSADWRFASNVASMTQLGDTLQTNPGWLYAHALPTDFLVAREVVYSEGQMVWLDPIAPQFEGGTIDSGQNVIFTNLEDLSLRYTRKVADPSRYSPKFVSAISYLLASYLAGPVIKGKTAVQMAANMRAAWDRLAAQAAITDANQVNLKSTYQPAGLAARGVNRMRTVENGLYRSEAPFWSQG